MLAFDLHSIKRCVECRGCEQDCPVFRAGKGYDPTRINKDILAGRADEWVASEMIWRCLECHTCTEKCPQNYSWEKVMTAFKAEAIKWGVVPKTVGRGIETFLRTGRLGEHRTSARKALGLPDASADGREDFLRLVEALKVKEHMHG